MEGRLLLERDVGRFFEALEAEDEAFGRKIERMKQSGQMLRYLAIVDPGGGARRPEVKVGPVVVEADHPSTRLRGSESFVAFTTKRYQDYPLLVQGAGAGRGGDGGWGVGRCAKDRPDGSGALMVRLPIDEVMGAVTKALRAPRAGDLAGPSWGRQIDQGAAWGARGAWGVGVERSMCSSHGGWAAQSVAARIAAEEGSGTGREGSGVSCAV